MSNEAKIWDFLLEYEIATEEELRLATNMNGFNMETLEMVLDIRTGYKSIEQIVDCEPEKYATN